jgi:hypothetical protein
MRVAAHPWGPFSARRSVYSIPEQNPYLPRAYRDGNQARIAYSIAEAMPRTVRVSADAAKRQPAKVGSGLEAPPSAAWTPGPRSRLGGRIYEAIHHEVRRWRDGGIADAPLNRRWPRLN